MNGHEGSSQKVKQRDCGHCHEPFSFMVRGGAPRRYCSERCAARAYESRQRVRAKAKRASLHEHYTCIFCGRDFQRPVSRCGRKPSYCSRKCREVYRSAYRVNDLLAQREERRCAFCSSALPPESKDGALFCGRDCRNAYRAAYAQNATHVRPHWMIHCSDCAGSFEVTGWRQPRKIRCPSCARKRKQQEWRRNNSWRRAKLRNAERVPYLPENILRRDGYCCQHCGRKTRPDWNIHHPLYPTVDHIVPLSRGGGDIPSNLQCLCRGCNMSKGGKLQNEQTRLVLM